MDAEHLRILSICYYVLCGLTAFISCFGLIYVAMGLMFVYAGASMTSPGAPPPPAGMGWIFVVFGGGMTLMGWATSVLIFLAGRYLKRRRNYMFCLIVAGITCLWMPFGTVLGVFTFVVMLRPSVKGMFNPA